MLSDSGTGENGMEESITPESPSLSVIQPIPLPLFAVQLQNILPVEIMARRFPEEKTITPPGQINPPNAQLNIGEPEFNIETRQAQVLMEVKVDPVEEPRLFEISVKLIGIFSYSPEYSLESVRQFLQQGSLSVLLPSARELLLSLSSRLQIPLIVLPLVQLTPPPVSDIKVEDTSQ